jgi:two-component system sensor histidine kinase DegS
MRHCHRGACSIANRINAAERKQAGVEPQRFGTSPLSSDSLDAVLAEAERELASAEARLRQLFDRAAVLVSRSEQERAQLQRFLEEFALEQAVYGEPPETGHGGTGPLIDVQALRRGAQELTDELTRATALCTNLSTSVQIVRSCREQFGPDRAFQAVGDTDDLKLQQAMNAAREDERRRLAREVHDGPAQVLANAIFAIDIADQVAKRTPDQVADELARVRALLKEGVAEVRRFMFDLRPTMLEDQGLGPTLRHFVGEYNRFFGMKVALTLAEPLPPLTKEQDLTIFRIVQEALQNIRKHAQVTEARISLNDTRDQLTLRIDDRGKGFDPATVVPRPGTGAGLPGMRERAKLIGAELTVQSAPGAGTTLMVTMALRPSDHSFAAATD